MKEEEFLNDAGLSVAESKIYLELLNSGPSSIRRIASSTGVNRGTTYEAIKNLVRINLVSYKVVGKRSRYAAESPDNIRDLITDKQAKLSKLDTDAKRILPALAAYEQYTLDAPKVKFYEDDEGVANILHDVINTVSKLDSKEYYAYSSRPLRQYLYRRFPNFTQRRIKENIYVKVIAIGTGGDPLQMAERKFIEESDSEVSSSYNLIYGNKVALISVSKDLTSFGVVIEEPGVAAMQRLLFEKLWRSL